MKKGVSMKYQKGFTLIELLVVIAIIGILAAIIAPNAFKAIEKAKTSRVIADLNAIKTASLIYYSDMGFWPPDVYPPVDPGFMQPLPYDPVIGGYPPSGVITTHLPSDWQDVVNEKWDGPYLEKWPLTHPWGSDYSNSHLAARESYDYEFWVPERHMPFNGVAVSIRNLPKRVYDRLLKLGDEGRFPYPLVDTTLGGYYSVAALVYEIKE